MERLVDRLPPEIARQLHPDRRRNEEDYWAARDGLLEQYRNLWIGFADGRVVASGTSPVAVFHASEATGLHPFFICVGREQEPCRIRRATFSYDAEYPGEPLPLVQAEFRIASGTSGVVLDRMIPDTGADASVLPWADCKRLSLSPDRGVQSLIRGVAGGTAATLAFHVWVLLGEAEHPCRVQADFEGAERILGRDVLNRLKIVFDGPAGEVVIDD
jgi:predicted aspartyl protease